MEILSTEILFDQKGTHHTDYYADAHKNDLQLLKLLFFSILMNNMISVHIFTRPNTMTTPYL